VIVINNTVEATIVYTHLVPLLMLSLRLQIPKSSIRNKSPVRNEVHFPAAWIIYDGVRCYKAAI